MQGTSFFDRGRSASLPVHRTHGARHHHAHARPAVFMELFCADGLPKLHTSENNRLFTNIVPPEHIYLP